MKFDRYGFERETIITFVLHVIKGSTIINQKNPTHNWFDIRSKTTMDEIKRYKQFVSYLNYNLKPILIFNLWKKH